ncbi:hypothetical protein DICPUDRAFT_25577 [Dictyostelium purpureum]|uniref:Carbohydrate binding domain-containing protein n=1 Tax=Dictyostelium purpureum TaxID=5786 RepID=F0Z7B9_DICPU|nr:uncharacterized protein DICPUDRAFT_25577 [Dictyostelium purpureum]EGC40150.1 hypothetical protein DICPUDRAFT_25577 [Dictyostelium purpureum]|eukprot:XP_003283340.1 hypothetical protein DICPUDRAFT_25577 [Dictyostelium purpureum]
MKSLLFIFLLIVSIVSGYYCGFNYCREGQVTIQEDDGCSCVEENKSEVKITSALMGTWEDGSRGGDTFMSVEYIIINNGAKDLRNIFIVPNETLSIRDSLYSDDSIWNIIINNGGLTLPYYQNTINSNQCYKFGFIIKSKTIPSLKVASIGY